MTKILCVFGTRPEAIKMAPIVTELEKCPGRVRLVVCVTAQHREMLDQVLSLFAIKPHHDLNVMTGDQALPSLATNLLSKFAQVIEQENPNVVLVQGDTTSAMVASLASFYKEIPVGHVEAGLRTRDRYNPFPEEINRRIISVLATFHFAPTEMAANALLSEGFPKDNIFVTGNTVIDALMMIANKKPPLDLGIPLNTKKVILVTAHRRENFGEPLENICHALRELARRNEDIEIVYPVHLNPNVQGPVYGILAGQQRIHLIPPLDYGMFVHLMSMSYLVLTDSGGIQEEAPALGKPVLVMRNMTERPEAVLAGMVKLVGTDTDVIIANTELLLTNQDEYNRMSQGTSPYGDGKAAERIVQILLSRLGVP
ncbi:non-hydrolyzing UDP-N-acetylglucosamine 2-epimerase [Chloroflexota bacterium]